MANRYPPAPQVVIPDGGVWPLRTRADWRDALHRLTNTFVPLLVTYSIIAESWSTLWIPAIFGIIDPLFSLANAADRARKAVYGVGGLVQTALLFYGVMDENVAVVVVGTTVTFVTSWIASKFTPPGTVSAA